MTRILLMATTTGYQTRAFGEAAERLGAELVFATDRCDQLDDPWQDGAIAIRFHEEERSIAAIVDAARTRPIDAIVVVGDRPTVIGAGAAQALGLPWHSAAAAAIARHKLLTRERLRDAGLPVPWFVAWSVDSSSSPSAISHQPSFPCVIKPVALSGSRGVMRADDSASLQSAVERLRALVRAPDIRAERSASHDLALIEGFIPGHEYAVEGLMDHGELHVLAIFDKPEPLDGPFFEETIYVTPSSAAAEHQRLIVEAITRAARAIGLWHGPVHAECRVSPREGQEGREGTGTDEVKVFVLEVAARPIGGLCARSLRFVPSRIPNPGPSLPTGLAQNSQSSRRNHFQRSQRSLRERITTRCLPVPSPESRITLEELLLRHALGEAPDGWAREPEAAGVMMIPIPRRGTFRAVEGVDTAKAVAHVTDLQVTAKPDQLLVPLPEGASYLGFIFARAATPAEVEQALRAAHDCLRIRIDVEIPVLAVPN